MDWWGKSVREIQGILQADVTQGLSKQQARIRLDSYGKNTLTQGEKKKSLWRRFLAQMNDFMVMILIAAALLSFFVSIMEGEGGFLDSIIILVIVVLNAVLGMVQESKAEKALSALKKLSAPKANVMREGKIISVSAEEVVPGDVLLLSAGDYVCADARLLESVNLKAEESAITGESLPVEKEARAVLKADTPLGDRKNMVISGSYITYGRGRALVTDTGMHTEVGKIAKLLTDEKEQETPLQRKLMHTGRVLGIAAIGICALIFVIGMLRGRPLFSLFMTSVSLAVAAIPEGLLAIVTIVLALGTQRMSKKHTIIRRLPAVETLGGATVICSDKTGTLTQNKMQVVRLATHVNGQEPDFEKRKLILMLGALCNDTRKEGRSFLGEPTEVALAQAAEDGGQDYLALQEKMPRVGEIPFTSERKLMTTVHRIAERGWISVTKGAPDVLLERCTKCVGKRGQVDFDAAKKEAAKRQNAQMAQKALRVIAVAFREFSEKPATQQEGYLEEGLVFAGLFGLLDPPRPEAKEAVALCKEAGIRTVMITGDHALTAQAMAAELGMADSTCGVLTGAALDRLSEAERAKEIKCCNVFARVSPAHKMEIVKVLQEQGQVVAMTGDGVNDAPALRAADIGCAMGKNGTEVAKGASDMILTDDNFATIVAAVQEGRGIYDNIKKAVHFLLSSNVGEIITIFVAMCLGWATPLLPIHLLWVNLVTDSLPAIALGVDPPEKDIMQRPPENTKKSMFADGMGIKILLQGAMIGMLSLMAFAAGHLLFDDEGMHIVGRTMAFSVLSLSQLLHAFNVRTPHSLFSVPLLGNPYLIGALLIGGLMQVSVVSVPILAQVFQVQPLDAMQWGIVAGLSFMPILLVELEKWLGRCEVSRNKRISVQ